MIDIKNRYWFRTPVGLEQISKNEISDFFEIKDTVISNKSIFTSIESLGDEKFKNLHTVDDVYRFIGEYKGVDNTKQSLNGFLDFFQNSIVDILKSKSNFTDFRATVSFTGKRNWSRFDIEDLVGEKVMRDTHLRVRSSKNRETSVPHELRMRIHVENDTAYIGLALFDTPLHRRQWRNISYDGQLPSTVAASMIYILSKEVGVFTKIIDPFCGSGTLLFEAGHVFPHVKKIGIDINCDAITIAQERNTELGMNIEFICGNSFKANFETKNTVLISNPPWGHKHDIENIPNFLKNIEIILKEFDTSLIIVSEDFINSFEKMNVNVKILHKTRIRGLVSYILKITKII